MAVLDIVLDEQLDALDPLRHLRDDDSADGIVPAQPKSVHDELIQLSFPTLADGLPNPLTVKLAVDASPGCGGIAWPAGEVLSSYVARRGSLKRKRVLELGSGTGLVGLAAAILGASVWITDQAPLLEIMRRNVDMNNLGHSVKVMELNWGDPLPQDLPPFDLILAADCVYFEPAFPLLVKTLSDLADAGEPEILFCYKKRRKADKRFFTMLKKHFTWDEVSDDPNREVYAKEAISLLRLHRKKQ
ncbi:S-adenosyl-L-methionine-dependent methyltransferase [Panus rudis PR-1116 ss-1]|nr:S-adenosyl-L-methionine-dependent methyltransferase [Panus rudis PR-1116 ss-1]